MYRDTVEQYLVDGFSGWKIYARACWTWVGRTDVDVLFERHTNGQMNGRIPRLLGLNYRRSCLLSEPIGGNPGHSGNPGLVEVV